jgi:hypothetical protein
MCPSVSICRPFQTISDWNHMPSYAVGQAARILDAIARVSSHICAASVSVATSQRSIAALWRMATIQIGSDRCSLIF